jgi:DNA-binding HxlR family transcriptional regulator
VAKATEVLAERWTPLIIRELLSGNHRYSEIQAGVPRMSPSLLSRRLRQLQRAGLVERRTDDDGSPTYRLTAAGEELRPVLEGLGAWGQRWMHRITDDELDPTLLMVEVYRRSTTMRCPTSRSRCTSSSPMPTSTSATGGCCWAPTRPTSAAPTAGSTSTCTWPPASAR